MSLTLYRKLPRPTQPYDETTANEVLDRLSNGETINRICDDPHMPARSNVLSWVVDDVEGFAERYHRARSIQSEVWSDEVVDISDDSRNDFMMAMTRSGFEPIVDHEAMRRSELRMKSRQWRVENRRSAATRALAPDSAAPQMVELSADPVEASKAYQAMIKG